MANEDTSSIVNRQRQIHDKKIKLMKKKLSSCISKSTKRVDLVRAGLPLSSFGHDQVDHQSKVQKHTKQCNNHNYVTDHIVRQLSCGSVNLNRTTRANERKSSATNDLKEYGNNTTFTTDSSMAHEDQYNFGIAENAFDHKTNLHKRCHSWNRNLRSHKVHRYPSFGGTNIAPKSNVHPKIEHLRSDGSHKDEDIKASQSINRPDNTDARPIHTAVKGLDYSKKHYGGYDDGFRVSKAGDTKTTYGVNQKNKPKTNQRAQTTGFNAGSRNSRFHPPTKAKSEKEQHESKSTNANKITNDIKKQVNESIKNIAHSRARNNEKEFLRDNGGVPYDQSFAEHQRIKQELELRRKVHTFFKNQQQRSLSSFTTLAKLQLTASSITRSSTMNVLKVDSVTEEQIQPIANRETLEKNLKSLFHSKSAAILKKHQHGSSSSGSCCSIGPFKKVAEDTGSITTNSSIISYDKPHSVWSKRFQTIDKQVLNKKLISIL